MKEERTVKMKMLIAITCMMLTLLPAVSSPAWADTTVDYDTSWYVANTSATSFVISDAADLRGLAELVNGTAYPTDSSGVVADSAALLPADNFNGDTIALNANIVLGYWQDDGDGIIGSNEIYSAETGGTAYSSGNQNWTPIGAAFSTSFQGTFDGNGCTISGIYLNNSSDGQGLFGYVGLYGTIERLGIVNSYIEGKCSVGGVVGESAGWVASCYSTGTVSSTGTGTVDVGGVAGSSTGMLTSCYNSGTVNGIYRVGGVAGYSHGPMDSCYNSGAVSGAGNIGGVVAINQCSVDHCYNSGSVNSSGQFVGGVAAYNGGTLNCCYNCGAVSGTSDAGGVVGYDAGGFIEYCYNSGAVSGTSDAGGVVGYDASGVSVTDCYSSGAVGGTVNVGGVIGYDASSGLIVNCYNSGAVGGTDNVGGVVGWNNSGTYEYCYYDKQMCTCLYGTGNNSSSTAWGKLTSEMVGTLMFSDSDVWVTDSNLYPRLKNMDTTDMAYVTATPIFLSNSETVGGISSNFTVGTGTNAVTSNELSWTSSDAAVIAISDNAGTIFHSGGPVTLTATVGSASKSVTISSVTYFGLTGVLSQTDAAPGTESGLDKDHAITWSIDVANTVSTVGLSSIAATTGAAVSLYSDSDFINQVTDGNTIPLTAGSATVVYIKVVAADSTEKYYAVTVNRGNYPTLGSVLSQTDAAPGTESGLDQDHMITWSMDVANSVSSVGLSNIVVSDGTVAALYSDSDFVTQITDDNTIPLTAGTATVVYIKLTAADAFDQYYAVTVHRAAAPVSHHQHDDAEKSENNDSVPFDLGTAVLQSNAETGGQTTVATIAGDAFHEHLAQAGNLLPIVIPELEGATSCDVELTAEMLYAAVTQGTGIAVQFGDISYVIPSSAIDLNAIASALGVGEDMLGSIQMNINITELTADAVSFVEDAAEAGGYRLMLPPVEFTITATYDNETYAVAGFTNYVERIIAIPDGVDPSMITTAVVVSEDGKEHSVPTEVFLGEDGSYYARVYSLTNSVYALIHYEVNFSDTKDTWYEEIASETASRMMIQGRGDGTFDGDANITRAEFSAILVRALGLTEDGTCNFSDVGKDDWYYGAVGKAFEYGLIDGRGDGAFDPNASITRQEAMAMIQRAAQVAAYAGKGNADIENTEVFYDRNEVSGWAEEAVHFNVANGLIVGSNGLLRPNDTITRAECATVLLRLLQNAGLIDIRTQA